MKRWSNSFFFTAIATFALSCAAIAQESPTLFSSDLVAWSGMQQPTAPENKTPSRQQPTPDPTSQSQPAPDPSRDSSQSNSPAQSTSPGQSTSPAQSGSQSQSSSQEQTPQTYTGTISKDGDSYTLKASASSSYKLDNDQQVQQYVGQRVRVTGTLDSSINLIHVDKIEPLT